MRQDIVTGLAVDIQWLINFIKVFIGTNPRYLQWPVAARVNTRGFVVVPKEARDHSNVLMLRRRQSSTLLLTRRQAQPCASHPCQD